MRGKYAPTSRSKSVPDVPVSEVARLMVTRGVHHVVITEDNEIRGIVSALDFVKQFIREADDQCRWATKLEVSISQLMAVGLVPIHLVAVYGPRRMAWHHPPGKVIY